MSAFRECKLSRNSNGHATRFIDRLAPGRSTHPARMLSDNAYSRRPPVPAHRPHADILQEENVRSPKPPEQHFAM